MISKILKSESRNKISTYLLTFQILCLIIGLSFSAGGGNTPYESSNSFGFLKAGLIMIPILSALLIAVKFPISFIYKINDIVKNNIFLILYFIACFISLFFAVNWTYSLLRLSYTLFGFIASICLIIQYCMYNQTKQISINKIINIVSGFILILPLYVAMNNLQITHLRDNIQSLNLIHPNIVSSFYAHFIIWHVSNFLYNDKNKLIHLLYAFLFLTIEFLIFSRTSMLILLFIFSIWPFISFLFKRTITSLISIGTVISTYSILGLLLILQIISVEKLAALIIRNDDITSLLTLTNRTFLWGDLFHDLTIKTTLVGFGYSVINENYGVNLGTGILYGAHNAYLSVLLGSGVFALLFIVTYLISIFFKILKHRYELSLYTLLSLFFSYLYFILSSISSEEIGISFSITFFYILFITNILLQKDIRK